MQILKSCGKAEMQLFAEIALNNAKCFAEYLIVTFKPQKPSLINIFLTGYIKMYCLLQSQ
jgi:hypothetical protein